MPLDDDALAALGTLLDGTQLAVPDDLPDAVLAAGRRLGWTVVVYLVDYEQRLLQPWTPDGVGRREPLGIDSTLAGRAFRDVDPQRASAAPERLWVPLVDGVERLGVLEVVVPPPTDLDDPRLRSVLRWFASLTGHLVQIKRPYGDVIERVRRRRPHTVAAELLWPLLPPLTFGCDRMVVSCALEPVSEVAGDAFDYAVDRTSASLCVLDAAGHDLHAGLLAAATLAAYRNGRRRGRGVAGLAADIDDTLAERFGSEAFVTGVLAELDLASGRLRYLNAGHPDPLVMRRGKVVRQLSAARRVPFGLDSADLHVAEEWLEPDDRVVLYTDGIVEARDGAGRFFGLDRLTDVLERGAADSLPAPETLRRVTHAVLDHQQGVLQDDATLLVAQWAGGGAEDLQPA